MDQLMTQFDAFLAGLTARPGDVTTLAMIGTGFGAFLLVLGLAGAFGRRDPVLRRIGDSARPQRASAETGLLQVAPSDPRGLSKAFVPSDKAERTRVQRQLVQAGLTGAHALRNYYLLRVTLGILLPLGLLALLIGLRANVIPAPPQLAARLGGLSQLAMVQVTAVLVGLGFFGPAYWLRSRTQRRRLAIEQAFPNALDLLQISVEAGLGLDSAMIRVANEIRDAAPEISAEFLAAEREIQAGRRRDKALAAMAERMQVEEVRSFVNVVMQSARFGTNVSEVLTTYATEMRNAREMKAQEMANKLPVKMSAVLASLMLPALIMLTVGPVVLRYIRAFG